MTESPVGPSTETQILTLQLDKTEFHEAQWREALGAIEEKLFPLAQELIEANKRVIEADEEVPEEPLMETLAWKAEYRGVSLDFSAFAVKTHKELIHLSLTGGNLEEHNEGDDEPPINRIWVEITAKFSPETGNLHSLIIGNQSNLPEKELKAEIEVTGIDKEGPWPETVPNTDTLRIVYSTAEELSRILQPYKDGKAKYRSTARPIRV